MVRLSWIACLFLMLGTSSIVSAGWPFFADDGLKRGSEEYYAARAADPPSMRQSYRYGKMWPVRARPVGPSQTFVHKYHTAHYWPHPYNCQDRASVRSIYDIQVHNGWQTATTFYSYHFDEETNQLNTAGEQHLSWLVTHVPEQFRHAYVQSEMNAQITSERMMSIEQGLVAATGAQNSVPVSARATHPLGRPASEVQSILQGAAAGALPPVISYSGASGSAGGGN